MATMTVTKAASPSATSAKERIQKMVQQQRSSHAESDDEDNDKGEGTSAAGAALAGLTSKHLDIAALLKEPLTFIPPRILEDVQQQVPYEPLPTGPRQAAQTPGASNTNGTHPAKNGETVKRDPDLASSSPPSSASKGKGVATNGHDNLSSASVPLPMNWPQAFPAGPGYHNLGNTCFLNSTLQALTHTAPLVACLMGESQHSPQNCPLAANRRWCLLCAMSRHVRSCFGKGRTTRAIQPDEIVKRLGFIAKGMRVGRQEDAHEFLRFALDKMQEAAASSMNPPAKTEPEKEKTFLNRIFGGKLRSRVSCLSCKHDSDTFDGIMDLSLDVSRADSVKEALKAFVKVDVLQGNNKYKCEKCKKLVTARKQFTISQAPQILHIHLKRFTPTGKKISGQIVYPEFLQLGEYMSDDAVENPGYRLYAVVCHSGSGPHSGHYFAHVRAGNNKWHCMNDSSVSDVSLQASLSQRNAYLLFYERCNRLGDAVGKFRIPGGQPVPAVVNPVHANAQGANGNNKRKDREEDESPRSPFPSQKIKLNNSGGSGKFRPANLFAQQQQQRNNRSSSPLKQHSSPKLGQFRNNQQQGRPYGQQNHSSSPGNFYGSNKHAQQNRPKIVALMQGRPN